ncbi:hypothetical protein GCM10011351_32000 [Paraliobacillus quinghaiensis]|uniref:Uncharacterized protein n=1 Tax=Paraliobacillus quinghaiensis TaxID=470815 RepID=A0A917TY90_9BACI|nr:hypothetical protein [Paraliobacillus quinghaiensis]GGM43628.1 hypothetical protein GCM10011351_32000 [Paraliobacillus quinghaiensis]
MPLKKNSKVFVLTAIILIAILGFYILLDSIEKPYGNDKESIEKVIKSIEGYENESIEILEIKDIYEERIVGFLSNNNPAYIQFTKNKKGNYEWIHIEKSEGHSFSPYLIFVPVPNEDSNVLKFMIVTNQENNIAKMELEVNGEVIEQEFGVNQNSVYWIALPKGKKHSFKYKYFDKDGNEIGNY